MGIPDVGNFFEKILQIRVLGEAGKLAAAVEANIDEFFYLRLFEETEKFFGGFSGESDRA